MKKLYIMILVQCFVSISLLAQEMHCDSVKCTALSEVIVIGNKTQIYQKQAKPLTSIEEYLRQSGKIEIIRRGSYAWEPVLNSMATERIVVTIDGMRIFGACTDKMDPITSYVEVSNLSEAKIMSGQQGSCHGATIGGSIDLKKNQYDKIKKGWHTDVNTGFESNANQKIFGAAINYADSVYYVDTDFTSRKSGNYTAGSNREVSFSQFRKYNISATSGMVVGKNKIIEASVIYDKATDVGYPALPMDVSLAEALITSLKFDYHPVSSIIKDWETKIYFNKVTHRMDDTTRPNVAIHMDMPGWTNTYGFYTKAVIALGKHIITADLNSFYNRSLAEMTMYPADPNESIMRMQTWPDVRTRYVAFFAEDDIAITNHSRLKFSTAVANHFNSIASHTGLESLQIFYPDATKNKSRILKKASGNYVYDKKGFEYSIGLGYGERAPSVSEGYGFYLFNSFDRYDYIGNPGLKNEKSDEANFSLGYKNKALAVKVSSSLFRIHDYIVAQPDNALIPMTIGATGVKTVTALAYADIINAMADIEYRLMPDVRLKAQLVYSYGRDNKDIPLPFISPLRFNGAIKYSHCGFSSEMSVEGNAVQSQYSPIYGEDRTPAYAVAGLAAGYHFTIKKCSYNFGAGVENLLDAYYSTFSDWNNIPRKGRNFLVNVIFSYD